MLAREQQNDLFGVGVGEDVVHAEHTLLERRALQSDGRHVVECGRRAECLLDADLFLRFGR